MPGMRYDPDLDLDEQDLAETFDETNVVEGEGDPTLGGDVEDVTQALGDRDDDEALALGADEFDEDAVGDDDFEADDELDYRASTEEHEDDLDGLGPEDGARADGFDEDRIDARGGVDGLAEEVADADQVEGGEDDFTNFQSRALDDDDLQRLGYAEAGRPRGKPDGRG